MKAGEIQGTCQEDEADMLLKFPLGIIQAKLLKRSQRGENHEPARLSAVWWLCLIHNIKTRSKIRTKQDNEFPSITTTVVS